METEVNCLKICKAACCRKGIRFAYLTREQYEYMTAKGAHLVWVGGLDDGGYELHDDRCVNLEGNGCGVRGTSLHPKDCSDLREGGSDCRAVRRMFPNRIIVPFFPGER